MFSIKDIKNSKALIRNSTDKVNSASVNLSLNVMFVLLPINYQFIHWNNVVKIGQGGIKNILFINVGEGRGEWTKSYYKLNWGNKN